MSKVFHFNLDPFHALKECNSLISSALILPFQPLQRSYLCQHWRVLMHLNLEVLNWCVIILSNCSSWFGSTLCPFSCREMNGLWGECSPHTSLICHWPLRENGHLPASAWLQTVIHPILLEQSEAPPHALLLLKSFPTSWTTSYVLPWEGV